MIKTKEPSPEMAEASRRSGFRARRSWREEENPLSKNSKDQIGNTNLLPVVTGSESSSNLVHNGFKTGSESSSNLVHNGFKTGSNQPSSSEEKIKSGSQTGSESSSNLVHNGFKTGSELNKINEKLPIRGTQHQILKLLFELSTNSGDLTTPALPSDVFLKTLGIGHESARTAIKRLIKSGHIERVAFGRGRAGWTKYSVCHSTFKKLLSEQQSSSNLVHNGFITRAQTGSQTGSNAPSSSSILRNEDLKLTTTSSNEKTQLSEEWKIINYSSLLEQGLQFSESHLIQLMQRTKHTSKMVQDAIEHFAFDLKHNEKRDSIKGDPLSFFMGIMQRGMYVAPSNFIDPKEAELDQYLTQQEAKLARIKEKLTRKEELDFEIWLLETTEEQRRQLAPQAKQDMSDMQKGILKNYWKSNQSLTEVHKGVVSS